MRHQKRLLGEGDLVDFAKIQDVSHRPPSMTQCQPTAENKPIRLTVLEAACLLRTSPRGIYAMVERRQLPGVVRLRRRLLFRTEVLLDWVY